MMLNVKDMIIWLRILLAPAITVPSLMKRKTTTRTMTVTNLLLISSFNMATSTSMADPATRDDRLNNKLNTGLVKHVKKKTFDNKLGKRKRRGKKPK